MSILELKDVCYSYSAEKPVLRGMNCTFECGTLYALVGKSGAGKSTLLSLMAGLDLPDSGQVLFEGTPTGDMDLDEYRRRKAAVIYQDFALFPLLTALENIEYPMELCRVEAQEAERQARELARRVSLPDELLDRYPTHISGGEQQRVAIARGLTMDRRLLLADEPTGALDSRSSDNLLELFGDARSIFAATADELVAKADLRPDTAQQIVRRKGFPAAEKELAHCRRNDIAAVASTDPEYPALLREIPDYPHVIYIKGCVEALSARCISIVGTREATPYGQTACNRLVGGLAERVPGLSVVSGLAFGIDVAAHRAALAAGVPTVAVVANPLPGVTPAQHTDVARDILARGGALVTELHSQSKQNGNFYLARNRIIAGLSAGCIVVESPDSGGSLFTAHCADSYDRTVMAVPGRITDRASAGTNHLIRNRKAQLVLTADDVIRELMWDLGENPATLRAKPPTPELTPDEAGLLGCFRTDDPLSVEALGELTGLNPGELATLLVGLELAGAVRQLPGNRYMKL